MFLISHINSKVLRCKELSPSGFRLYCLISSLARKKGYCYASNHYLSNCLRISIVYIQRCLQELENLKFIERHIDGDERKIYIVGLAGHQPVVGDPHQPVVGDIGDPHQPMVGDIDDPHQPVVGGSYQPVVGDIDDPHQPVVGNPHQPVVGDPIYNMTDNKKKIIKRDNKSSVGSNQPTDTPRLPKVYTNRRWSSESLPYKLGELLIEMIQKRRPGQYARYLTTEEGRELLIQKQAYSFDQILSRDGRTIDELLEVLQWSQEDTFWQRNILSAEKFRRQYSILLQQMRGQGIGSMRHDHNPELTQALIKAYRALIANPQFVPSPVQHTKFIEGAEKMVEFFQRYSEIDRTYWIEYLMECLEKHYLNHSKPIFPGNFCSNHTWEVLMPQYLLDAGLVVWDEQEEPV